MLRAARGLVLDPDFLEEMFDLRMAAGEDAAAVGRAEVWRQEMLAELDQVFVRWEAGAGDLSSVEDRLARLKYLDNLVASARP